jgi:hypothetical protein
MEYWRASKTGAEALLEGIQGLPEPEPEPSPTSVALPPYWLFSADDGRAQHRLWLRRARPYRRPRQWLRLRHRLPHHARRFSIRRPSPAGLPGAGVVSRPGRCPTDVWPSCNTRFRRSPAGPNPDGSGNIKTPNCEAKADLAGSRLHSLSRLRGQSRRHCNG